MIVRYHLLAERLRADLQMLERVVERAESALQRATQQIQDQDYFLAAAALDLHGFYTGIERLLELIADELDARRPAGSYWHRELLTQMSLAISGVRPVVIASATHVALMDYLEFRHVVRNVYTFNLRSGRVIELVRGLRPTFDLVQHDLLALAAFLDELGSSDSAEET